MIDKKDSNNKDVVLRAVKQNGIDLRFASEELQSDFEVVLEAVYQNGNAFNFVHQDIRDLCDTMGYKQAFKHMEDYVKKEKFAQSFELSLQRKVESKKVIKI